MLLRTRTRPSPVLRQKIKGRAVPKLTRSRCRRAPHPATRTQAKPARSASTTLNSTQPLTLNVAEQPWPEGAVPGADRGRCHCGRRRGVGGVDLLRALVASVTWVRVLPGRRPARFGPAGRRRRSGCPGSACPARGGRPVPIAGLAKIMTGSLVLRDLRLPSGGSGPAITVAAADVAALAGDVAAGAAGRQGGAQGAADRAAGAAGDAHPVRQQHGRPAGPLDAGSRAAFVAKMNAAAGPLGLGSTRYVGVSGADPATASAAAGPCRGRAEQLPGQCRRGTCARPSRVQVYGSCSGVAECRTRRCTRSQVGSGVDAAPALASTAASAWVRWRHGGKCGGITCRAPARPASAPGPARRAAARRWRGDRGGRRGGLRDGIGPPCARRLFPATTWSLPRGRAGRGCSRAGPCATAGCGRWWW